MKNYRHYRNRDQRPMMTSIARSTQKACPAAYHGWKCTREVDHHGRHEAGLPDQRVVAAWEED